MQFTKNVQFFRGVKILLVNEIHGVRKEKIVLFFGDNTKGIGQIKPKRF